MDKDLKHLKYVRELAHIAIVRELQEFTWSQLTPAQARKFHAMLPPTIQPKRKATRLKGGSSALKEG